VRVATRARAAGRVLFLAAVFAISIVPGALTLLPLAPRLEQRLQAVPRLARVSDWYHLNIAPIEELRPLAALPEDWQGRPVDTDKNYARFERWFDDHLGLRKLMIRTKNELDYQLFRSSTRVYFGKDDELYGRNLAEVELPATEALLAGPGVADAIYRGVLSFGAELEAQGVTMVMVAPVSKQYFTRERLPFFAPRVPDDSRFMALYGRLKQAPTLHFVDVYALLAANQARFPIFRRQDFHWTDLMALAVARETTDHIARLEGSSARWRHRLRFQDQPFLGVEARFSARLNGHEIVEPALIKTWTDAHTTTVMDAASTGFEFETDRIDDPALLPPACMYGNSFGDGMLRAGLAEHFQKFSKLSRGLRLPAVPALIKGRCKYLIVQVLDIQADRWLSLAPPLLATPPPATP
jgi:hypothetical protein